MICQTCKYHRNRPSRCRAFYCEVPQFVGRKEAACADHKVSPVKLARMAPKTSTVKV